ncbi:MAG: dynamin family protein [Kiritimatiellae bacterium]|nr:dynamin family protein [Kiritimatiellia bacterium]
MNNTIHDSLQNFAANRTELQRIYADAETLLGQLKMAAEQKALATARANLDADTFKVLVIGEFKRGKSTFINALLGEEILPSFAIPCTAVINEIKYAETKRAVLHFKSPLPANRPKLAADMEAHIAAHLNETAIPPLEVPIDRLEEFVTIPDPGKDQTQSVEETPFAKVELYWPIDLCRNNVEIIDSPGLNEHGTRTKVTTDYITRADAVVFVLSCSALCSETELNVIDDAVTGAGHEEIFFVCNRFDEVRERERPRLVQFGKDKLSQRTKLGEDGIVFLSSLDALEAKESQNEEALKASGFSILESKLVRFLVEDRGRMKLLRPSSSLRRQLRKAVGEVIPLRRAMLAKERGELEQKVAEAQPKLEDAKKRQAIVLSKIDNEILRIGMDVQAIVARFVKDCADEVPGWLASFTPKSNLTFLSLESTKKQCERLAREQLDHVQHKISEKQKSWQEKEFMPRLESGMELLREKTEVDMKGFFDLLDQVKTGVGSGSVTEKQSEVSGWQRVAAAGVGWIALSPGGALMGANSGFKGLFQAILPQLGLAFLLGILGLTNPVVLFGTLLAGGGIQAMLSNRSAERTLRETIVQKISDSLRNNAEQAGRDTADKVASKLREIKSEVNKGLENEIATVRESLNEIVETKRKGDKEAEKELMALDKYARTANQLADSLDSLEEGIKF